MSGAETLYLAAAAAFQAVMVGHFAMRRWRFAAAVRHGWVVYALSVPFATLSLVLLAAGSTWWLWLGGFVYLAWAAFGFFVEYRLQVAWRTPVRWSVFGPYVALYLATSALYWWPAARLSPGAWLLLTVCFGVGTTLNVASHRREAAHP
jgi:hypothetical protein